MNIAATGSRRRQKTILFPFMGDRVGGSYISSVLLIRLLVQTGYRVIVVVHIKGVLSKYFDGFNNIEVVYFPLRGLETSRLSRLSLSSFGLFQNVLPLVRLILKKHVDVVHTNDARMHELWVLPARLSRVAHVWHQRTRLSSSRKSYLFLKFTSTIICISKYVDQSLPDVSAPTFIIPNAVDDLLPDVEVVTANRSRLTSGRPEQELYLVGWFGTMSSIKRPLVFFEAIAELIAHRSVPLLAVVFGRDDGDFQDAARRILQAHGIMDTIRFMGITNDPLPLMAACDTIVSTSVDDGFGRTLIEAMSVGVPVVAANSGGHPEIVKHLENGILVAPEDPIATADGIQTALTDTVVRNRLIRNGKNTVSEKFNSIDYSQSVTAIYDSLVGKW